MSDVATTATVCVATGTIASPFCAYFGFDVTLLVGGIVGGLIGCVIAQTLIPDKADADFGRFLKLMVGSVLLAAVVTLATSPWLIRTLNLDGVPPGAVRLIIGALVGGIAQPLAILIQKKALAWFGNLGNKGVDNV